MSSPRPATHAQLYNLNKLGCLQHVDSGAAEPLTFDEAWKALENAQREGVWKPKHSGSEASRREE